jgi:tetratricopeptide (TPR) repeat protein
MTIDHVFSSRSMTRRPACLVAALAVIGLIQGAAQPAPDSGAGDQLTSRPRPTARQAEMASPGDEIRTGPRQRRRVSLPDGSVLYVNENTTVKLATAQRAILSTGEVFVDAAPGAKQSHEPIVVETPKEKVTGQASRFAVRATAAGTGVLVTHGKVRLSGFRDVLVAGQQRLPGHSRPLTAARASKVLDWARDLMAAAESPLVPGSKHAGGALIAIDPNGQEAKLSLHKYHVDVYIEDGFARTTIDQTYFNHEDERLEGTFYFPLPADASLSRLAMYVGGNLMEGGMVERDYARSVYERILYQRRDPALLEWVDGTTFKMRVFPLEPRQEKRIILSYTQKLPSLYGQLEYRFPAGHNLAAVRHWSFHARVKHLANGDWSSPSHQLKADRENGALRLTASEANARLDRDVVLHLSPGRGSEPTAESVRFSAAEQDGHCYLMLRYRPHLPADNPGTKAKAPRCWVILFESSGDRDPLVARAQVEVVRHLLGQAESDDTFTVLTAGTRAHSFSQAPQPVTPDNVQAAVAFLEKAHLIGALDLGRALAAAGAVARSAKNPYLVHVGSGIAAMGERRRDVLAKRIPEGTRYVGIGVGRRWARDFMKAAAERSGGYFTQINPDEPVVWRTFELAATLNTPRLLHVAITDPDGRANFRAFANTIAQGEEMCAVARLEAKDAIPESIRVAGTLGGKPFLRMLPVTDVAGKADYLPRTWAKLEIERLLAEDAVKHKDRIVALSKAMYVMTPYTSLLVLENEDMYTQYKVDRGRKDHWAIYLLPKRIPVLDHPDKKGSRKSVTEVLGTIALPTYPRFLTLPLSKHSASEERENSAADREKTRGNDAGGPGRYQVVPTVRRGVLDQDGSIQIALESRRQPPERPLYLSLPKDVEDAGGQGGGGLPPPASVSTTSNPDRWPTGLGRGLGGKISWTGGRAEELKLSSPFVTELTPQGTITRDLNLPLPAVRGVAIKGTDHPTLERILRLLKRREGTGKQAEAGERTTNVSWIYARPAFTGDDRIFYDLLAYAPGMNISLADMQGILEAEAKPDRHNTPGQIDDGARKLFEINGVAAWQAVTFPSQTQRPAFTVLFDHQGRFTCDRTLSIGLREHMICDGKTLWHLYPELGIGARRQLSRFHRADFAELVPWALPRPEDLAHGADLRRIADRTVALIPDGAAGRKDRAGKPVPYRRFLFVFARDGRLAEKQLVLMPANRILSRETYAADGTIRLFDKDGKQLDVRKYTLKPATEPNLQPNTKGLVVLSLPYRTREHVLQTLKIKNKAYRDLRFADALPLFAADVAAGNGSEAFNVFQQVFYTCDQRQIGFYVLLASCGQNLDADHTDVMAEHPEKPLAQYLALHSSPLLRKHASQWAVSSRQWAGAGFLKHLALSHALYQRWQNDKVLKGGADRRQTEIDRAVAYIRENKGTVFGWALLCLVQDRAGKDQKLHRHLADLWPLFKDVPGLGYAARYELARSLWHGGDKHKAQTQFRTLYEQTLKESRLPRIDADFRAALLGGAQDEDAWADLLHRTALKLIKEKHRPAIMALAWQCWQLEDRPQANQLLRLALDGMADQQERLAMTLAGIEFFWQTTQLERADQLLGKLLADPKLARRTPLWRLAARLAERRDMPSRALESLERALDAEFRDLPPVINLAAVRDDYGKLLEHYDRLADAMVTLRMKPPPDFLAKVVRAADHWRALDRDGSSACHMAGKILRTLGDKDLSWDYLTTPVGLRPNEAGPWQELAQDLSRRGDLQLADRAYTAAFEAEPTNAQLLWDRAQNLRQAGKTVKAAQMLRRLAEGQWQPRFQGLQAQARWQLKDR